MPDLNVRKVEESLILAVKTKAAGNKETLRDFVIRALTVAVYPGHVAQPENPGKTENFKPPALGEIHKLETRAVENTGKSDIKLDVVTGREVKPERQIKKGACPRCEKDLVPWGPKDWHCMSCGRNFMPGEVA